MGKYSELYIDDVGSLTEKQQKRKQYMFLIRELVGREIKRKYSRSFLGIIWSVLSPLLRMTILAVIFSQIFDRAIPHFPIYIMTGQMIFGLFTDAANASLTTLVDNRPMLIKVKFPMEVFVFTRSYSAFVNFMYSMVAYILMLVVFRVSVTWYVLYFPVIVFFTLLFALGTSFILATAYVFFGDIKHLWAVITQLLFFTSAIFWSVDDLTGVIDVVVRANPIFNYIHSARQVVMWQEFPSVGQNIQMIFWGVFAYALGYAVLRKNKTKILIKI
ncbi:MAG: ABC transporter permease [Lachnospiraceae bacterium]|nr:ABC transporter permease [Lachnospiraceae bacterium]